MLLARIQKRLPLAYLANSAVLGEHMFYVDQRVIVPRSYLAETLRSDLTPYLDAQRVSSVLDLCTGSGCLAILAAHTVPGARVDAVDLSEAALQVAQRNVSDHGLADRIAVRQSDMFAALRPAQAAALPAQFDVILSNPPYVKTADMLNLP